MQNKDMQNSELKNSCLYYFALSTLPQLTLYFLNYKVVSYFRISALAIHQLRRSE